MKKVFALAVAVLAVTMISSQGALGQSPDCSTITPQGGGSLTDASGNTWSFGAQSSGAWYAVLLNGSEVGQGALQLIFNGGNLYNEGGDFSSWWEWNGSGFTQISGDPRGSSCGGGVQPNGVAPPSGQSWVLTFDDEFTQDSSINTNYWNGGAGNTDWCDANFWGRPGGTYMFNEDPNNPCAQVYSGLALDSYYGLELTGQELTGGPSAAVQTSYNFLQEFGYWEASYEVPSANDGEGGVANHSDFWMHAIPEGEGAPPSSDPSQCSGTCLWGPEINVGERLPGYGSDSSDTSINFSIHDNNGSGAYTDTGDCCGDDLSQGFHTYGLAWINDGSGPYGSMQIYLDGVPVYGSPWVLSSSNPALANGIYMFLSNDNDGVGSANSFNVQYVRVWQAQ